MAAQEEISRLNKRMKRSGSDFLSRLPDDLLLRVLSLLPAKEAVRSASLSHRWSHLSSLLPVRTHLLLGTHISSKDYLRHPSSFLFDLEYIKRSLTSERIMLNTCEIIPDEEPDTEDVGSWSEALALRGIRELLINFKRHYGPDASSVVRCKSLDKLELHSCSLSQGSQVGCTFLTHLRLVQVHVTDEVLLGFASQCKSLTSLEMIECDGFKELRLVDARVLKRLIFQCTPGRVRDVEMERIEIVGQNLEVMELRLIAMSRSIDIVAPRLRSVLICVSRVRRMYFSRMAPGLWKLINGAPDISCLQLRGAAMDCLSFNPMRDNLNMSFPNLKRLYVNLVLKSCPRALVLVIFLQNLSMLEQLNVVIIKEEVHNTQASQPEALYEECARRVQYSLGISNRLQHVTISGFMGEIYEMSLSRFILMRAQALKKMNLSLNKLCTEEDKMNTESLAHWVKASRNAKLLIKRAG